MITKNKEKVDDVLLALCQKCPYLEFLFGPYFSPFGLNIPSKCGKIRTRKTLNEDTFCAVLMLQMWRYPLATH